MILHSLKFAKLVAKACHPRARPGSSAAMEQLRAALAEIAVMRRDGLLTDEEVRARDQPSCARGAMLRPCARERESIDRFCNNIQMAPFVTWRAAFCAGGGAQGGGAWHHEGRAEHTQGTGAGARGRA